MFPWELNSLEELWLIQAWGIIAWEIGKAIGRRVFDS